MKKILYNFVVSDSSSKQQFINDLSSLSDKSKIEYLYLVFKELNKHITIDNFLKNTNHSLFLAKKYLYDDEWNFNTNLYYKEMLEVLKNVPQLLRSFQFYLTACIINFPFLINAFRISRIPFQTMFYELFSILYNSILYDKINLKFLTDMVCVCLRTEKQFNIKEHNNTYYESILKQIVNIEYEELYEADKSQAIDIINEYYNIEIDCFDFLTYKTIQKEFILIKE